MLLCPSSPPRADPESPIGIHWCDAALPTCVMDENKSTGFSGALSAGCKRFSVAGARRVFGRQLTNPLPLVHVRFGSHCGRRWNVARCPKSANNRRLTSGRPVSRELNCMMSRHPNSALQGLVHWQVRKSSGSILKTQNCGSCWFKPVSMPQSIRLWKGCSAFCWKNCIIE